MFFKRAIVFHDIKRNQILKVVKQFSRHFLDIRQTNLNFIKIISCETYISRRYKVAYCLLLALLKRDNYVFSHILERNAIITSTHKSHLFTPNCLNIETSQRRVVPTSRRPSVESSQRRVSHGETSHVELVTPKSPAPISSHSTLVKPSVCTLGLQTQNLLHVP